MSATTSFDGLCGIISRHSSSDQQVRCSYDFGHHGECSWKKRELKGPITGAFLHTSTLDRRKDPDVGSTAPVLCHHDCVRKHCPRDECATRHVMES